MNEENLWGDIPKPQKITTPYNLLLQQGTILEKMTNSLLTTSIVITSDNVNSFIASFRIIAPTLGNYSIEILSFRHGLAIYPVKIYRLIGESLIYTANDEPELKNVFKTIFTSTEIRTIISALLNQIYSKE